MRRKVRQAVFTLSLLLGAGAAAAQTSGTVPAGTCLWNSAGSTTVQCAITPNTLSTYNSAQSNAGSYIGPLDPYGPNPSTGIVTADTTTASGLAECRYIRNLSSGNSAVSFFIPLHSLKEWDNFLSPGLGNYGSSIVATDTCARPFTPAAVIANLGTSNDVSVQPCAASAPCYTSAGHPVCLSPSPSSYFAQPVSPTTNGISGYSSTHLPGSTIVASTGTATVGVAATGSGSSTTYPGVNADGTLGSAAAVPMAFTCQGGVAGTTWTQTATSATYTAENSAAVSTLSSGIQNPSWQGPPNVTYADVLTPPGCGTANNVATTTAPALGSSPPQPLCPSGANASAVSGSGPWTWTCTDSVSGGQSSCSAPVLGVCGTAAGVTTPVTPPPSGLALCNPGDTSSTVITNPDGSYSWTCTGPGTGGSTVSCSAPSCVSWGW